MHTQARSRKEAHYTTETSPFFDLENERKVFKAIVTPDQIWADHGKIPVNSAPSIELKPVPPSQIPGDDPINYGYIWGEDMTYALRLHANLQLVGITGTPFAYRHDLFKRIVPASFAKDRSYGIRVTNKEGTPISHTASKMEVDYNGGVITFYADPVDLVKMGISRQNPPFVTYYEYIGLVGVASGGSTSLPISDSYQLLRSEVNDRMARLIVGGTEVSTAYVLPPIYDADGTPLIMGELVVRQNMQSILDNDGLVIDGGSFYE